MSRKRVRPETGTGPPGQRKKEKPKVAPRTRPREKIEDEEPLVHSEIESGNEAPQPTKSTSRNIELGQEGEQIAAEHIERLGWTVLEKNWRAGRHAEIDIIAREPNGVTVFVEVKTRTANKEDHDSKNVGFWSIHGLKENKIINAAIRYLARNNLSVENVPCRFDVVVINFERARCEGQSTQSAYNGINARDGPNQDHDLIHVMDAFHRLSWSLT